MKAPRPITVMMADDRAVVRRSLCALLEADGGFSVVGEAPNGRIAVKMARAVRPDVILMDISMPMLNGLDATRQIMAANPAAKVIILSAHSDDEYLKRASALGVSGFIEKQTFADLLTQAVRTVFQGGKFFSPALGKRLPRTKRAAAADSGDVELTILD